MRVNRLTVCLAAGAVLMWAAATAQAGRFEDFTKKAAAGPGLKTLAATYFGGEGIEEFVAAGGQPDGTIVAFGNAWGPKFPAAPAPVVLGKGKRQDGVPDTVPDKKGNPIYDRANPNIAGMIVRYAPDLKSVLAVTRFDWGVASIETGIILPDGSLVIAGRCTEAFLPLAKAAPCVTTAAPAEDPGDGTKKPENRFGPYPFQNVPLTGDVYVAKLAPDAGKFVWVHVLTGLRQPPTRLFPDNTGGIVFDANGIKRITADGKTLAELTKNISEGDRVRLQAVSTKDGTILHGGDRNTRTNKEPWRQPFLNGFDPAGTRLWRIWDWDSKTVGSDAKKLESDSAIRAGVFAPNGDIIVGGWSDGGNSVFTRQIKDVDTPLAKGTPGYGMSCWGMKGANSLAYLMRFDPKTFEMKAWTLWVSYLPVGPDGKGGGNPNFANIKRMEMLPDGSVAFAGQAATGLIQTPQAWFQYKEGGKAGGHYVAVFNGDFTNLWFSSYLPAGEISGLGQTKGGILVASRAAGKDDQGNGPPVVNPAQKDFGGGQDGHLILLEAPKGP